MFDGPHMDEFVSLLKTLKKNDKITQNVLFMISESSRHNENAIGQALIKHYRSSFNKEPILDFLFILCSKDTKYLSFFKAYKREFGGIDHKFAEMLKSEDGREMEEEQDVKRMKLNGKDNLGLGEIKTGEMVGNDVRKERMRSSRSKEDLEMRQDEDESKANEGPDVEALSFGIFEEVLARHSGSKEEVDPHVLNNKYLRIPANPSVLYPPNQCKLCGLRFENSARGDEAIGIHIDEHRRRARALGEKDCISREFFPTLEAWTKNIEKVKLSLKVDKVEKIIHSGSPTFCDVCHNKIEVEWDDHEDSWILKDAVSLEKAGEATFCHRRCVL